MDMPERAVSLRGDSANEFLRLSPRVTTALEQCAACGRTLEQAAAAIHISEHDAACIASDCGISFEGAR